MFLGQELALKCESASWDGKRKHIQQEMEVKEGELWVFES